MDDLHSILANHHSKKKSENKEEATAEGPKNQTARTSEIPDLFFDEILVNFKLSRVEILVLMFLYRLIWCRPNLYKLYGIGQVISHNDLALRLNMEVDELLQALRKLESMKFIETIRSGQYFVRKYFTEKNDQLYGQTYDDF